MAGALKRKLEALEAFTVDVIYDRRSDWQAQAWGGFLRALSQLFRGIVSARYHLYDRRLMRAHHLGCQVIVVGNLTVGGTGKTPVVEKLARHLQAKGRTVAILSRGYKSKKEPFYHKWWRWFTHAEAEPPRIVSNGQEVLLDSEVAGDEPFMLAKNLPGVVVLTDKDRVKAGIYAIRHFGADTLILDDGFQYFRLKDHFQLLLIDKSNPFGNGQLLPRGILREPISHLRRASYVFLTKSDGKADPELEALIRQHRPDTELIECTHQPRFLQALNGSERLDLDQLEGHKVAAFSAIAVPESFEKFVDQYGANIVLRRRFLDHHRFREEEIQDLYAEAAAAGAEWLITTEKDAVRIPADWAQPLPVYYLRVEIAIIAGAEDFEAAVNRISRRPSLVRPMAGAPPEPQQTRRRRA
ncbi:MAG: tetraacyldisaccharide 4'-kinase [Verrucomicrobiota bacterium JB022]|nr:tetraacyldisaccharide 4'-kinase [Verrucomicrobiota bacterium JB022]